jgi:hypothetical protein
VLLCVEKMVKNNENDERDFSIELKTHQNLTRLLTSSNGSNGGVLIEGTLGKLQHALFVEPEILEVKGNCGVLRLNLRMSEVKEVIKKPSGGEEV